MVGHPERHVHGLVRAHLPAHAVRHALALGMELPAGAGPELE